MAQKCYREMGNFFWSTWPKALIKDDFKILRSWDFVWFKGFGRLEAVASLDAYQITKYQFPSKTHHFFLLPDFRRIREEVSKSGILWLVA